MTQSTTPSIRAMLQTHPLAAQSSSNLDILTECLEACFECEAICTSCADACLSETEHAEHLRHCIRLNLDCADICATTGRVAMRRTQPDTAVMSAQLQACMAACRACGDECEAHAKMGMQHCEICAAACRRCEAACQALLDTLR